MCAAFISPLLAFYIIRQSSLKHCVSLSITPADALNWVQRPHRRFVCALHACEGERVEIAAASKSEQAKKCLCLAPIGFHVLYRYNRGANKKPVQLAMVAIRVLFIFSSIKLIFFSNIYLPVE
jgi:hypothetical protein